MPAELAGWTSERVLALAPDAASARAGQGLAGARHWSNRGGDERAVWGECQGSAKDPYRAVVDLTGPAFSCTCPSRKFPCKHGLGLLILSVSQPPEIVSPPAWVNEWIAKRAARSDPKPTVPKAAVAKAGDQPSSQRRREANIADGIADLERWLADLIRLGIADAPSRPAAFWETAAARLVDAQAPGLARQVRLLPGILASGEGWQERFLGRLGLIQLALTGYQRINDLPEPLQAELRSQIGWTIRQEDIIAGSGLTDHWLVLGQSTEDDGRLRTDRIWLRGRSSSQTAMMLVTNHSRAPREILLPLGFGFEGELAWYPGAASLRALVKSRRPELVPITVPVGFPTIAEAIAEYSKALAANPWLEFYPLALAAVTPLRLGESWLLVDGDEHTLPLNRSFSSPWELLSLSGGEPIGVFGEWDGRALTPLSAVADGQFWTFEATP